jgi:hypothetical protein
MISPNVIKDLVFLMKTYSVLCEERNENVRIIYINANLQIFGEFSWFS